MPRWRWWVRRPEVPPVDEGNGAAASKARAEAQRRLAETMARQAALEAVADRLGVDLQRAMRRRPT